MKLPASLLSALGIHEPPPRTSLRYSGRALMLELWDRMDAGEQKRALLEMEAILGREKMAVSTIKAGKR